jgi:protein-glutamine gamma-glutamyltransferase
MTRAVSLGERGSGWRLAAFAGLSGLAAWRYAGVEDPPPSARVIAIVALAVAAAAAVAVIRHTERSSRRARRAAAIARAAVLAASLTVALLMAGVPAELLSPGAWGRLTHDVHGGLQTVGTTLWPYAGHDRWTRLDILLPLVGLPIAAAALGFWPARRDSRAAAIRYGARQLVALALLLALYVLGVVDSNGGWATGEGLLLLALLAAWLWLPGLRSRRLSAALVWLAAAGALAAALAGPLGGAEAWLNYRAWNLLGASHPGDAFAWDQTYGPIRWSRSQRAMFTVRARTSQLWKTTTLDRFDGVRFVRSGTTAPNREDLPLPLNDQWYSFATFTIQGLRSELLPSEQGTAVGVNFDDPTRIEQDGTARTIHRALRAGDRYTVLSYMPQPTLAELRSAPRAFPAAYRRYTDFDLPAPAQSGLRIAATDPPRPGQFITGRTVGAPRPGLAPAARSGAERRILASPYASVYRLARRLAAGMRTQYDVALAIQSYLKGNYTYSERPPARRYPLEGFLFVDRIGYCQQFSGAMALMLRMDGVPARVAAGFLPGSYDGATGSYLVRAVDAHSWVEVYFTGIGWVRFDPTPPRSVLKRRVGPVYASSSAASLNAALAATVASLPQHVGQRIPTVRRRPTTGSDIAPLVALIVAAVACLLALLMLAVRWAFGHARLRRSLAGDGELAAAELPRALRRLGYAIPPTVTLAQIERLVSLHGGSDAARYVRLLRERRYTLTNGQVVTLRDRRRLRRSLTAPLGLDARARGLWAFPPGTVARQLGQSGAP